MRTTKYSSVLIRPSRHPLWDGFAGIASTKTMPRKYQRYFSGSDSDDMRLDWQMVGQDIRTAMKQILP